MGPSRSARAGVEEPGDQRFGRARALAEIDGAQAPFFSDDCQHLYFVALNSVFEAQLQ